MKRIPIAVAASILAAAGLCSPAEALPQSLPYGAHAGAPAPLLLPARYHRHRHYQRHDRRDDEAAAEPTDSDAAAIKPGQWEFAAQLEATALPSAGSTAAPDAAAIGGGATKSNYAICVAADKAVPSAFVAGCQLDAIHRDGGRITWSMTCTNRQNAVRSDGVAQYRGDTMTATMVSHLPSAKAGGKTIDVAQSITGRYLGPCPSAAPATATTAGTTAAAVPGAAVPAATTAATVPDAAAPAAATTTTTTTTAGITSGAAAPAATTAPTTAATVPTATVPAAAAPAATTAAATSSASAPSEGTASAAGKPEASTAAPPEASAAPWAEERVARHRHYRRHRRHYAYRRHRHGGGYGGGYSGFGPNPYSANGY